MKSIKTITISFPFEEGREIQKMAEEEERTVSDLVREAIRQYRAKRVYKKLAKKTRATARNCA